MPEDYFGEAVAARFDERYAYQADPSVVDPIVAFLVELAGDGDALELGIGTGRIALPLAERGVRVHGIDLSEAMVARLQAKPGAEQIGVTVGDFASTAVDGSVLRRVPRRQHDHEPDDAGGAGRVLPERRRASRAGRLLRHRGGRTGAAAAPARRDGSSPSTSAPTHLGFDEYDVARQGLVSHHYWITGDKVEVFSPPFRYVWPAELDLMARLAGMTLRERWGGWQREPFTSESTMHVSVWEKGL